MSSSIETLQNANRLNRDKLEYREKDVKKDKLVFYVIYCMCTAITHTRT